MEWLSPDEQEWAARATTRQDAIRETMMPTASTSEPTSAVVPSTQATKATKVINACASASGPFQSSSVPPTYAQVASTSSLAPVAVPSLTPTVNAPVSAPVVAAPSLPVMSQAPPVASDMLEVRRSARPMKKVTRYIEEAYLSRAHSSLDINGQQAQLANLAELFYLFRHRSLEHN